jgi:Signal peptidase (SPase) II
MPLSLPVRLLHIAAVAVMLAVIDWSLKTWAQIELRPDQVVMNTDRPWHVIPVAVVIGAGLIAVARTPLLALGAGVVIGGGLGNMGELAIFGRVTDFIPLGIPFRGAVWSPADLFLATGLVLLWIGAVRARRQAPMPANHGITSTPSAITITPGTVPATPTSSAPSASSTIASIQRAPLDMEA